ncbi:MAG TPA: DMT family transporter [Patescibacteria group bacterium]|nr:DMT family transporter [Patescibacteria group bacterium]
MKHTSSIGSFAVMGAAILWSLDGLLRRQLFTLPSPVVVFWEHLLGLIVLLPLCVISIRAFKKLTKKQWISIIVVSLLSGALGTMFYTKALAQVQFMPFSVVVLLQQLQPLFAISAAGLLLKEPITKKFLLLAIVALIAAYLVSFPDMRVNFATGKGTAFAALLAIGAAASWGASTALSKYTLKKTSFLHVTAARFAFTPLFAFLIILLTSDMPALGAVTVFQWKYLLAITFSTGLMALAMYYFGLQRIPASRSTILELTWPISAILVGYFFLHESLTVTQWIGSIVLIMTMVAIVKDARVVEMRHRSL